MTQNKKGGKGHKRAKKVGTPNQTTALTYKDPIQLQEYARVIATLGECRLSVEIVGAQGGSPFHNKKEPVICKIPGSFRKRVFINKGDYILVSLREFQQGRVDAICKYMSHEAKMLMKQGEIP